MKARYLLSAIITLALSYSFAAQAVDCDELARHIENQVKEEKEFFAYNKPLFLKKMQVIGYSEIFERWNSFGPCERKWSDKEYPYDISSEMDKLLAASQKLEKYTAALTRCTKTATQPCPYAKEIISKIQTQKILNSKCADLYTQSVKDNNDHWAREKELAAFIMKRD